MKTSYIETVKIFFTSKKIMLVTSVLMLNWITNTLVYYGISFHTDRLAGDPYLNFFLSSIAEGLSYVACEFMLEKFGRKWPYSINMALAGVTLLCVAFVPDSLAWLVTVLALIAKFGISFTFNTVYIVTAEMYPTSIRNSIVSICAGLSSVGGIGNFCIFFNYLNYP
jgi:MFS transporter, OCT family, solute carrier family 22 (organic cation transporter), member 4/5